LKDNLTNILENLSDDKIEVFTNVITGPDPYRHANYELLPIFDKIKPDAFVKSFLTLSNENKEIVRIFIKHRYDQLQNSIDLRARLLPDIENLQVIKDKLENEEKKLTSIEKLQVNKYIKMIEDAIIELQKPDIR
jgi:organic radical activating enzyme